MRGTRTIGQAPVLRHVALHGALIAIASAVAIAVVHLLLRGSGRSPETIDGSMVVACLIVAVAVGVALLAALLLAVARHRSPATSGPSRRLTGRHRAAANATVWSSIAALAVGAAADAFTPLPGGAVAAGAVIAGLLGAVTGAVHRRAHRQSAYLSFNVVALLLAAGCLASMSMTTTGAWWTLNFSTLGTSNDLAAAWFNFGLILSGLAMAAMSGRLAGGLERQEHGARRGAVATVRVLIAVIGVSLAGVGVVPIDTHEVVHNVFACLAAAAFALLASFTPVLVRRLPRRLTAVSRAALAIEVVAYVAYEGTGLVSLTVFEIVAFALVFVWLIALVVTTHTVMVHELAELDPITVGVISPESRDARPLLTSPSAGMEPALVSLP